MARPRKEIDAELVRSLAEIQCTQDEIAHVVGCDVKTLRNRGFSRLIKEASEGGKTSLRRAQWSAALGGNPTMLIWLGKQVLGQKDQQNTTTTGAQTVTVVYEDAKPTKSDDGDE